MNIANFLARPFTWLRSLFQPGVSENVETIIELLECDPEKFTIILRKDVDTGQQRVYIVSTETMWIFPDDTPFTDVRIHLLPDDLRLEWLEGGEIFMNYADKVALLHAVNQWLEIGEDQE